MTELTSKELEEEKIEIPEEAMVRGENLTEEEKANAEEGAVTLDEVKEPKIIDGSKVVAIIDETKTATHYKLENGTTTWVEKIKK